MQPETVTLSEVSQKEKDEYRMILLGEQTCGAKWGGGGIGMNWNLGLIDANYSLWNG